MSAPERCPRCGGINPPAADWCGQCYLRFTAPPPPPSAPPSGPTLTAPTPPDGAAPAAAPDAGFPNLPAPEDLPPGSAARELVERATAARAAGTVAPGVRPASIGTRRGAFAVSDAGITWTCVHCDTVNPLELQACSVCGTPFARAIDPDRGTQLIERDPGMTALVSLFYPGAGHAYIGMWGQAFARGVLFGWVALVAFLSALQGDGGADRIAIVFALAAFLLWASAAHDAFREANREPGRVILKGRAFLYVVLGLLMVLVVLLVQSGMSLRAG